MRAECPDLARYGFNDAVCWLSPPPDGRHVVKRPIPRAVGVMKPCIFATYEIEIEGALVKKKINRPSPYPLMRLVPSGGRGCRLSSC